MNAADLAGLGHGLYFVLRAGAAPYVLCGASAPVLPEAGSMVLSALLDTATTLIASAVNAEAEMRRGQPDRPRSGPAEGPVGVGVYYVPTEGRVAVPLTGPETPGLRDPELSVALALVYVAAQRRSAVER